MKKVSLLFVWLSLAIGAWAQQSPLSVDYIMRDPKWMGTQPSEIAWSEDSKRIYFQWNPEQAEADSLYSITTTDFSPKKLDKAQRMALPSRWGTYNASKRTKLIIENNTLFALDCASGKRTLLVKSAEPISNPQFGKNEQRIVFQRSNNLFVLDRKTGVLEQITQFKSGQDKPEKKEELSAQDQWLVEQQQFLLETIKEANRKEALEEITKNPSPEPYPLPIFIGNKRITSIQISPDERFVSYLLIQSPNSKNTIVPNYVTESGYTEDINARSKVGGPQWTTELFLFDTQTQKNFTIKADGLSGLKDIPSYYKEYPNRKIDSTQTRGLIYGSPIWDEKGQRAIVELKAMDNKDRWIALLNTADGSLRQLDRQHDEAWIGGPGISSWGVGGDLGWMPDQQHIWFQSEESGYSHLYTLNVASGKKNALTSGQYEVFDPQISKDKKFWYFTSSEDHPGIRHFYKMPINGGKSVKITSMKGNNEVSLSPDEKWLAIRYSYSNVPWELYVQENKAGATARKITDGQSEAFKAYPWRDPEMVTFKAQDGTTVHARLYKPKEAAESRPAVIFVHGAGYLQNVHYWWSSYFREYMFHNLLADMGYTVLDIDYRASSGYGRDFRTGIYRHMGGKDLSDQVDGAKYLIANHGVNAENIGIYGGSYGGFITLMALFTQPDVFASGAALRSVTDWAHYNHGYTSNILNTPVEDSIAYAKSSPIYFAEGLQGDLLICHGMVDTNVHFSDVVRLAQRLIELKKDNWEMAVYPVENHGFVEPASWTDEYKRILKLFEETLK
ncbi:prolyl oligopeptidase family serine peptidase [Cytophagales bacterium LB-30]|uniref:Prolyl oligopeptidase family serine peptidase n=1 Tax=Shiella aurantiaca TaxID=3058365 RepID=A0ABT8F5Y7_9BACT|nr:prolyl oligopeptidase family serine peptidase [Shiella aurantiaca]MDN4165381.1 prolyl oligopeptidase family serine peptidase [Shiella aurantiaca]